MLISSTPLASFAGIMANIRSAGKDIFRDLIFSFESSAHSEKPRDTPLQSYWVFFDCVYSLRSGPVLKLPPAQPPLKPPPRGCARLLSLLPARPAFTSCWDSYLWLGGRREGSSTYDSEVGCLGSTWLPGQPLLPVGTITDRPTSGGGSALIKETRRQPRAAG